VGLVPQNNSIERSNLDTKGSRQFAGILKTGVSIDTAIKQELPRMVYTHSVERVGAKMECAILLPTCIDKECIESFRKIVMDNDTKEYKGGYLVNTAGFEGVPIDAVRIQNYERALQGIFAGKYHERHLLLQYTQGLCHVIRTRLSSGQTCFVGSCEQSTSRRIVRMLCCLCTKIFYLRTLTRSQPRGPVGGPPSRRALLSHAQ
jgi:hypothetical protein